MRTLYSSHLPSGIARCEWDNPKNWEGWKMASYKLSVAAWQISPILSSLRQSWFIISHGFHSSEIQTEHSEDGLSLLHRVWDFSWKEQRLGWNDLKTHPLAWPTWMLTIGWRTSWAVVQKSYMWLLEVPWASSEYDGWVPRSRVPRGRARQMLHLFYAPTLKVT